MIELRKCKLKNCLLNEKEGNSFYCSLFIPTSVKDSKPDNMSCKYYATNFKDELVWLKSKGGLAGIILSSTNKKSDKELKDEMKEKKARKKRKKKII